MDASNTNRLTEFRAKVGECRAKLDAIVWGGGVGPRALVAQRLDSVYETVLDALLAGAHAGFPPLIPLACAMDEVLPAIRSVDGLTQPRVRSLLLRSIRLLERVARDGSIHESDLVWLRRESAAATLDAAWSDHARFLEIERRTD